MIGLKDLIHTDPSKCVFKIARRSFIDPDILKAEREKIFSKCWIYLGHVSEIPHSGDFVTRRVGGRNLIFTRDNEGEVRVFLNACTHRGAMVCREKSGNTKVFQCFYHAWTFNTKGELVGLPEASDGYGEDFNCDAASNLPPVPRLADYRGFYFINYDPEAISLDNYLADSKEFIDLVVDQSAVGMEIVGGTHEYSMRANWKLLCENSADGYHAKPTHKTYFEYLKEMNGKDFKPDEGVKEYNAAIDLGQGHGVTEKSGLFQWGRPVARWIPAWGEVGREIVDKKKKELIDRFGLERATRIAENDFNMIIFPNLVINNIMAVTIRTFYPLEPGYMEVNQWCIAPKDEEPIFREMRLKNFLEFLGPGGFATPDDNEALELCQQGFHTHPDGWNDLSKGMAKELKGIVPRNTDEFHMRVFWKKWHEYLTNEQGSEHFYDSIP